MKFSKYSGAGNTFLIIEENRDLTQDRIASYCSLHQVDGLIELQGHTMTYYNADGSEAAMCGNGLRCSIKYLWDKGDRVDLYEIQTKAGLQRGKIVGDEVLTFLQAPSKLCWDQKLLLEQEEHRFHFIHAMVPHAVFFTEPTDIEKVGRKIRHHAYFAPLGTNVNFVSYIDPHRIRLRTYERGVERETLACGTGSIASAIAAHKEYGVKSPVQVEVQSKEILTVTFSLNQENFTDISLQGAAIKIMPV